MIRKIIKKILKKDSLKAKIIDKHFINKEDISKNALKIVNTLQENGFEAFIVGGAVRDLLIGIKPKDFDVATNATPIQINKLFHKSRIIGKRFQIVLVPFYRSKEQEVIEVTTFRAIIKTDEVMIIKDSSHRKQAMANNNKVAMDSSGQVLSDNVWGTHGEDASRRDFTINSLYYDPVKNIVYDFFEGINDLKAKTIKIIGDANIRYKEDPVRIVRLARFIAKTNFTVHKDTLDPIIKHVHLIANIPPARLSDELLKMLMSGVAVKCIDSLKTIKADKYILPWYNATTKETQAFIDLVLQKTDERLKENKSVSPGFIFSAIYWPLMIKNLEKKSTIEEFQLAIQKTLDCLQLSKRVISDMQEIWLMQPSLEKRLKSKISKIIQYPKFRAGYDFLVLRSIIDEKLKPIADWWTVYQEVEANEKEQMIKQLSSISKKKPRRRKSVKKEKPKQTPVA